MDLVRFVAIGWLLGGTCRRSLRIIVLHPIHVFLHIVLHHRLLLFFLFLVGSLRLPLPQQTHTMHTTKLDSVSVNVEFKVTLHEQVRCRGILQY